MAYPVNVLAGDSLCRIARRNGFSNCGTIRGEPANVGLLDRPLVPGQDQVMIPQIQDRWIPFFESIATGRRWVYNLAQAPRQAITVRFVRTGAGAPANGDAIQDLGISRFPTGHVDIDKANAFPDDQQRGYDAGAFADPNAFNVEVVDPNVGVGGGNVTVYLEALEPIYPLAMPIAYRRFPAGNVRDARSLSVTLEPIGHLAQHRRRSCYLRLVVDPYDQQRLPNQTVLVSDRVEDGDEDLEILDQSIRATYEDATCNRAVGERCILARAEIPLRRGQEVDVTARILRANRTGVVGTDANGQGDDGIITRETLRHRVYLNARRVWAQNEIAFDLSTLETVDAPSEMLTVSEPDGASSSGLNAGGQIAGVVQLDVDVHVFNGQDQNHQIGPLQIQNGRTPLQTAQDLAQLLNQVHNLTATVSANPAVQAYPAGSVDVLLSYPGAWVGISNLTADPLQDAQQKVHRVAVDPQQFAVRAGVSTAYAGSPMQRALFKAFQTNHQGINLFVVQQLTGVNAIAHTMNAQAYMLQAHRPIQAIRNCIVLSLEVVQQDLTRKPYTLAHEMGHALSDNAEHCRGDDDFESLMLAGTTDIASHAGDQTKRVSSVNDDWYLVVDQGQVDMADNHVHTMGIRDVNMNMPARIANNQAIQFQQR